jgi:AcrR family transcriptional regulator
MGTTARGEARAPPPVARARQEAIAADEALRATIVRAYQSGTPVPEIATAAGVTRGRIYQILDDHRNLSDPAPTVTPAP